MKPTTKLNLRMSDDLNNNSVMIPSILNDSKEQSSMDRAKVLMRKYGIPSQERIANLDVLHIRDSEVKECLADQKRRILNNVIRLISEADLKEFDKV